MNDQLKNSRVDFGNFQLNYDITPSSDFNDLEYIDENYVAILRFSAPGTSVIVVASAWQLEYWFNCFELSAADGGVYMKTLPIMCTRKEYDGFYVAIYKNKLSFRSGTMSISINLADCLEEFANYVYEIWQQLEEKEESWWS